MKFNSLYKLYSMNWENFEEVYLSRLNSESSLKFFIEINGYPSFFFYHNEINTLIYKIREMDKRISILFDKLPPVAQKQYIKKSLIDEIHFSNSIEGVVSTRKEIFQILNDIEEKNIKNDKNKRFLGIINRYSMLLKDESLILLNSLDIRNIYDEILFEEIKKSDPNNIPDGEIFRKDIVTVATTTGKVIHQGVMPESKIIQYVDKSLAILNDESIEPMIRIAIFHYLFSYIHPFYDGNGRINRYIASYMFSKHYSKLMSYRISMTIKENITSYYDAFKYTNDPRNRGDITTFVYEFLNIIYKAYEKTEMYALEKIAELSRYYKKVEELNLSKHHASILKVLVEAELFSENGVDISSLIHHLEISNSTCRNVIKDLIINDLVSAKDFGKKKYYTAKLESL